MKKGKSRNKRKKTRSRLLWIVIAVIAIAAVISAVCVAGMLATKENAWRTPEELLVEYMDHIPKQEYEEMYAMLHIEASGNVSQEDFVTRNSAIYEGIEVRNMAVQIIAYDEEQMTVTYQASFDTVAGTISLSILFKHFQNGSVTGNLSIITHFFQCVPDKRIEPIYYPSKIHQITGNSIFVLIVLQFVQQHISHIGFVVIRDQMNRQINTWFQKSHNNRGFQKCSTVNRDISVNSHFLQTSMI